MPNNPSLTLAGSGIKFLSHLTEETKAYIRECDKLFYLINDPVFKQWLKDNKTNSESLDQIYHQYSERKDCYRAIASYTVESMNKYPHVCMLIYGHPTAYSSIGLEAIKIAVQKDYDTTILPGISAADCLFADIGIDPASSGCQSFEATDFLIYHRHFDPCSHLILWQIDVIGLKQHSNKVNRKGLKFLQNKLLNHYSSDHNIILYEAAQYPGLKARKQQTELKYLSDCELSPVTTLYIPPYGKRDADMDLLKSLT